jgi:hypothetical protein
MFFPAADTIAFAEGGTEVMRINSSGQVGIGTASPDERLTIQGNYKQSNGTQGIQIVNTTVPYIQAFTSGGNNPLQINGQDLRFFTGSSFGAESEKMRITAAGLIGINTTVPTSPLTMANNSRFAALNTGGADVSLAIVNGSNDVFFGDDSVNTGTATWRSRAASVFQVNLVERMRLNNSGALVLQGGTTTANGVGITFPATQSASSDANTLDDYEEGTWTPTLTFSGGSTGIGYSLRSGNYTKIGNTVNVMCIIVLSNKGSSTGAAAISLPFTVSSGYTSAPFSSNNLTLAAGSYNFSIQVGGGQPSIDLYNQVSGGNKTSVTNTQFSNTTEIVFGFSYQV